jgi:hypothetical protein
MAETAPGPFPLSEPIVCEQLFDKRAMGFLWGKRDELDTAQVHMMDAMFKGKRKSDLQGVFTSKYTLANTSIGKKGYGRLIGSLGSLERMEKEIRGTLCGKYYEDIDIVNCHPVLLWQFAKRYYGTDLEEVRRYCDNRDKYLEQISDNRDVAKTAMISLMYGGSPKQDFLKPFYNEVQQMAIRIMNDPIYADLLQWVVKQGGNTVGSFLSYVLQTEERRVMMSLREQFMKRDRSVDVLAYDGVQVRMTDEPIPSTLLRQVEQDSLKQTGYSITLDKKPLTGYPIPEEKVNVAPGITLDQYLEQKALFEENHFYYKPADSIAEYSNGELMFYEVNHAKRAMNEWDIKTSNALTGRTSFVGLWLNDETRRVIDTIDMKPSNNPRVFSTPLVLRYTQCALEESKEDSDPVALFCELIEVLSNHDKPIGEYMTNWLAHILQKPFNNPLTSLILSGRKGCGKDTLGDFIQEWIIGDRLSHNYTSTDQFWDKYDTDRLNKLFIKLEEASGSVNKKHIGDMNPKGIKSVTAGNYCRYFMTTNEGECVKVEDGERRFFVVACGKDWVKDTEQWKKVRRVLFNENGARQVGEWLMARDLSNYDTTIFPKNEYLENLMESSKSTTELFIEDLASGRYSGSQLWDAYRAFLVSKELIGIDNNTSFGRSLHVPIRDGLILKKRETDGVVYIKK